MKNEKIVWFLYENGRPMMNANCTGVIACHTELAAKKACASLTETSKMDGDNVRFHYRCSKPKQYRIAKVG